MLRVVFQCLNTRQLLLLTTISFWVERYSHIGLDFPQDISNVECTSADRVPRGHSFYVARSAMFAICERSG